MTKPEPTETDRAEAEEYKPQTREGLTAYFAQSDTDKDGRVDWDIDTLVSLILTLEHQTIQAERERALERERAAFEAGRERVLDGHPQIDGYRKKYKDFDDWLAKREGE